MTKQQLHALMKKCKKGARVGIMHMSSTKLSLMWWYGSDHYSKTITQHSLDAETAELFNALELAAEAMK